jgi:HEAT repeat protein
MKGPFSPAVRSLLPGVDISDDYLEVVAADHHLIRKLAGALTSRDSSLRWAAAEALVNIAAFNDYDIATEPLLGALEQALRSEDARVRRKARSGLVEGENEEIVAMLGRVLDSPSTEVCHDAVRGLAEIARQRDIGEGSGCWWPFLATLGDALAAALRHPDPAVRAAATEPFAGLAAESPEAAGERAGLLLDHPDPAVRRAVMASLQDFGEGAYDDTGLDVLLGALAKALDDADDEVKRAARAALDPRRWEDPAPLVKFLRRRAASPGAAGQQAARELLRGLDG